MSSTSQPAVSWHRGRVAGWLVSVDHKRLGALYLGWAAVFFVIAGVLTLLMRIQMTQPDSSFLGSSTYAGHADDARHAARLLRARPRRHRASPPTSSR